ncbi:endonuclease domain-containing protein [Blastococcus sp. LR1]|uniref:endonuclease domain-containing protein n=1 Tax=Blastococcus sp. LR1 TaxID=2877000 RepID=UPI001CC930BB|nr:endonuclease domain-containing protein [Blastococcus sp. LR1]MCA0145532.1 endonuclease VII domain-containing protein [Blastococcus sp. LR1]
MNAKVCPACDELKEPSDFGRNRTRGDGLSFYCLSCNRSRSNAWYRNHRRASGYDVRDHSWVPAGFRWCPACRQAVAVEDFTKNSALVSGFGTRCKPCHNAESKEAYWRRRYGITKAVVDRIRASQGDRCAICGDAAPQHLDHDHDSGRIRALLCQRCNHGLGLFRDEPDLMHAAALYVRGHREAHALDRLIADWADDPDWPADVSGCQ